LRTILQFTIGGALALAAIAVLCPRWLDPVRGSAVLAAAGICYAAAFVALIPMAWGAPRRPDWMGQAALGAIVIRLMLTLAAGAAYLYFFEPHRATFMASAVGCYLILLAVETTIAIRLVHRYWRTDPGAASARPTDGANEPSC